MTDRCPHCGWPDTQPFQVLSRHPTPEGLTVWIRCACGSIQVWTVDLTGANLLTRGRPQQTQEMAS